MGEGLTPNKLEVGAMYYMPKHACDSDPHDLSPAVADVMDRLIKPSLNNAYDMGFDRQRKGPKFVNLW